MRARPADMNQAICDFAERGASFAVAVVLQADGSTPAPAATKAVIEAGGAITGTVGGGAVEAESQRRAAVAIRSGQPEVFDFEMIGRGGEDPRSVCGGVMRVLIDPTAGRHAASYRAAAEAVARRQRGVLLTRVRSGTLLEVTVRWVAAEVVGAWTEFPGPDVLHAALAREAVERVVQAAAGERIEVLVEPVVPRPVLLIVGGGHVGQAVARQASWVGFEVVVIEDRPEFANPALFPEGTTTRCGHVVSELDRFPIGADTYIVLVTRGHRHDAEALAACIHRPAAYLGMIGSRRKVALVRRQFLETGRATAAEFDRVHAPIGLDIGAVTVPEIATSIVAQLIAVRRRGWAPRIPRD